MESTSYKTVDNIDFVSGMLVSQISGILLNIHNMYKNSQKTNEITHDNSEASFSKCKYDTDVNYIKASFEENIQYQIKTANNQYKALCEQDDFRFFCEKFWMPQFRMTVNSIRMIFEEIATLKDNPQKLRIHLLIAWTPALQKILSKKGIDAKGNYFDFCNTMKLMFNEQSVLSTSIINGWNKRSNGTEVDTILLYHLMRGIPTIVLFLNEKNGILSVDTVKWGFSAGINDWSCCKMFENIIPESNLENYIREMLYCAAIVNGDGLRKALIGQPFQLEESLDQYVRSQHLRMLTKVLYKDLKSALYFAKS